MISKIVFYSELTHSNDQHADLAPTNYIGSSTLGLGPSSVSHLPAVADETNLPHNTNNHLILSALSADDQSDDSRECLGDDSSESKIKIDDSAQDNPSQSLKQVWPSFWSVEQQEYFKKTYSWLYPKGGSIGCIICNEVHAIAGPHRKDRMRVNLAQEWVSGSVSGSGKNKQAVLKSLRKKVAQHVMSNSHNAALAIKKSAQQDSVKTSVAQQCHQEYTSTCNVFRTAYYIAINNRPYTDHPDLLDLQKLNGVNIGRVLHSNAVCADIVDHIAS
jgi:hypothetical protein